MKRQVLLLVAMTAGGCASRPQPISPYVPPEAMYSTAGTLAAMGGVVGTAAGASMMDPHHSPATRNAGAAVMASGAALLGAAIVDAIEVQKEREKVIARYFEFLRNYYGDPYPEPLLRLPPPPPPEAPFRFDEGDSPLSGKDAKP